MEKPIGRVVVAVLVALAGLGIWAGLAGLPSDGQVSPRNLPDPLAPTDPLEVIAQTYDSCNVQACSDPANGFYIDCGVAFDGPAYFADAGGETLATCGGACMAPDGCDRELCGQLWTSCGL